MLEGKKLEDFEPIKKVNELSVIDIVEGDGRVVSEGAAIKAHYTGALAATGLIFQSSHDFGDPVVFGLSQVIKGWTVGVPGMRIGGKRRLIIPSAMAYGSQRVSSSIPPNSDMVFDIELIDIVS